MFRTLALLPILTVAAHTGNPRYLNIARQTADTDCATVCKALTDSISGAGTGGLAVLCTSTVASNYVACYDCEVKISALTQAQAQSIVDSYSSGCKASGRDVGTITISGDGSAAAGASGAATAASGSTSVASGSAPAASGASGGSSPPAGGKTSGAVATSAGIVEVLFALVSLAFGMVI